MSLRTDPTSPRASLLGLPGELREKVYREYFRADGGYVYDGDSDKLIKAEGQPVDISLRGTCRQIADETRHLPFSLNAITFSTVYRQDWQKQAGALGYLVRYHTQIQADLLCRLRRLVTPDMYTELGVKSPQYMPIIKQKITSVISRDERRRHSYAEFRGSLDFQQGFLQPWPYLMRLDWCDNTVSFKRAIAYILRLVADKHTAEFTEALEEILPGWTDTHLPHEIFDATFDPWAVPSIHEVAQVSKQLQMHILWDRLGSWYQTKEPFPEYEGPTYRYRRKYRFSAAAVAIRFLNQIPEQQRLCIRKLVVNEDRVAVGDPECHAIGLIPFCKENPTLHVEQRLNLWRNLILNSELPSGRHMAWYVEAIHTPEPNSATIHQIFSDSIHGQFVSCVMHVLEVLKEGMPSGSYHFLLDGGPDLNLSTDLFNTILKRGIAWLTLHTECVTRGIFTDRNHHDYPFRTSNSVEDVNSFTNETSIFRCNFNLNQPWDCKKISEAHGGLHNSSLHNWLRLGGLDDPEFFDISTPALNLVELRLELFEREEREDRKALCPTRFDKDGIEPQT
ncbi:hypothetical protein FSARC_10005 [Fusarium sarcochroum]|uniref:Uncharacterized protein n=1 Tax=Fusarium sarcochroum TaxID=1208366 RepID=A0A8H4TPV0_9HYPO|nr:hypothetical protein FSARC_10005 [Fusarium sarcochroum]